jgi:hypothetical protein
MVRHARSLKDKRSAVKSLKDNLRNRFNVSVAEVGGHDSRQQATLGVAMVGRDSRHLDGALAKVVSFVRAFRPAELIDYEVEIF